MDEQIDPSIVNLAKAIGQSESGGKYDAKGKSGEYGAYQFTKPTWTAWATKFLGDGNAEMTPENQDKVAYSQIKEWGSQGYKPAQIASLWNSGKPDWEGNVGTNKFGVKYDTPAYVKSVGAAYDKISGGGQAQQDPQNPSAAQPPKSFLQQLQETYSPSSMLKTIEDNPSAVAAGGFAAAGLSGLLAPAVTYGKNLISKIPGLAKTVGLDAATSYGVNKAMQAGQSIIGGENPALSGPSQVPPIDLGDLTRSNESSSRLRDVIGQQLANTIPGRNFMQSNEGKQAIHTVGAYGYAPNIDENGVMNFDEARQKIGENQKSLVEYEKKLVGEGEGSTLSAANFAGKYIGESKELANFTPTQKREAAEYARKEIQSYGPMNRPMPLGAMIDARHQQYAATKGKYGQLTSAQIAGHKAAAFGFRQAVRQASDAHTPGLYDAILKEQQNHINAEKLIKKLHNKKALQNNTVWRSFLRGSARYAEIYIGDKLGGPLGAIIGAMAGEHLNRKIDKRYGKTIFETKGMKAAMDTLKDTKPEVYTKLIEALQNQGITPNLKEPGEGLGIPETRVGVYKDVKKNVKAMSTDKKGTKGLQQLG